MSKVLIKQTAAITALGNNLEETWQNLCAGKSALAPIKRFAAGKLEGLEAGCVDLLDSSSENKVLLLLEQLVVQLKPLPENTFLIWTGIKGGVEQIENSAAGKKILPPQHACEYRQWLNHKLGLSSQGMDINAACASSTVGISIAADMIAQGEADNVIVIGADWVSRFTFSGFAALRALSTTKCRPFDMNRDGLALGDAAAAVHLVSEKEAEKNNVTPMAKVEGWGIANDANHITGPARDGCGLTAAIHSALTQAALKPDDIVSFCAHGTGTVFNDAMELSALENSFGSRRFPLFSVKGALGHTLGAAGALETALSVNVLNNRITPPTFGLGRPEKRAEGRVSASPQNVGDGSILTTNSGFGGINAALIIGGIS
ncbi:MAG: hypothetical protein K9L30_07155 [Desulfobacterales bacterium]|nr:hypothetical protein [Desulfobacterales bacterium]